MRALRILAGAISTSMTLSHTVDAQQSRSWLDYCTPGAMRLCASVEVSLIPGPIGSNGPTTTLVLRAQNMQGIADRGTTPWDLWGFSITGLTAHSPFNFLPIPVGFGQPSAGAQRVISSTSPAYCLPNGCSDRWELRQIANSSLQLSGSEGWAIVGCDASSPGQNGFFGYYQTCGGGWVTFTTALQGEWEFTENTNLDYWTDVNGVTGTCGSACASVTPEPFTVVTLATGLLGLGGLGRRRRDKRNGVSSSAPTPD